MSAAGGLKTAGLVALLALAGGGLACKGQVGGETGPGATGAAGTTSGGAAGANGGPGAAGATATGVAGGGPVGTGGTAMDMPAQRPSLCASNANNQPGYRMVRRLSQNEFNRSLRDVFGTDAASWVDITFPGELARKGFYENYSDALTIDQPFMAALVDKTFDRAQQLLTGPKASTILAAPCVPTAINAACAESVVRKLGYRLFRRPVTDAEVMSYVALYNQGVGELMMQPLDALAGMLGALLQSPNTLYITQLGALAGTTYKLDGYEIASVMAYGLTGSAPSQALLDSVATGALGTASGISAAARTLIDSPAGQAHLTRFFQAWLQHDRVPYASKDATVYTVTPALTQAMVTESQMLIDTTYKAGGGLVDLLLSPQTFVNKALATHYKWDTTGLTDTNFVMRQRPAGQGLGFLAQGAQMTRLGTSNSSSPTQRGVFILHQLMCRELGNPPPVVPEIVPPSETITTRQRYEEVHGVAVCASCHGRIDGIGFGFENFDGAGVYRTTEVGKPINAKGKILDLGGMTFDGAEDLVKKLVAAPELSQCFAAQLTSYVYGVSVADGLCIAPSNAYPTMTNLGFKSVLDQVVNAAQLTTRAK